MSEHRSRHSWWRTNRWALLALPVVVVVALATNGSRLPEYWWDRDFREGTHAAPGETVRFSDEYDDGYVRYPIEGDVQLLDVRRTDTVRNDAGGDDPVEVADGGVLWEVRFRFEVDPEIVMRGCQVALVDDDTRWEPDRYAVSGASLPLSSCAPGTQLGPGFLPGDDAPSLGHGDEPRPPRYESYAYVVTPSDAEPTAVRLWWFLPRYVELEIG